MMEPLKGKVVEISLCRLLNFLVNWNYFRKALHKIFVFAIMTAS